MWSPTRVTTNRYLHLRLSSAVNLPAAPLNFLKYLATKLLLVFFFAYSLMGLFDLNYQGALSDYYLRVSDSAML